MKNAWIFWVSPKLGTPRRICSGLEISAQNCAVIFGGLIFGHQMKGVPRELDCHFDRGGNDSFTPCKGALLWGTLRSEIGQWGGVDLLTDGKSPAQVYGEAPYT